MDNIFDKLMECLFIESDFCLGEIKYIEESYGVSTSLYIAHKPQSDYFIYLSLPASVLSFVTNDIQIKLSSLLKRDLNLIERLHGDQVNISPSFEKNATLIIFTSQDSNPGDEVSKQTITIEEDPYFFKKQVLVVSPKYREVISDRFDEHKDSYIPFLQGLISNTNLFNKFMNSRPLEMSNEAMEYSFAAKLYEKLPFLVLPVKKSDSQVLQKSIDDDLSQVQQEQCDKYLKLDENDLNGWFAEIVKEESDA